MNLSGDKGWRLPTLLVILTLVVGMTFPLILETERLKDEGVLHVVHCSPQRAMYVWGTQEGVVWHACASVNGPRANPHR